MTGVPEIRLQARELYFRSGGEHLRFRTWGRPGARATVALLHALGEHSGRLGGVGAALRDAGFAAAAFDLRGHGRSGGRRGHVERFAAHVEDLDVFLRVLADQGHPRPAFLLGQGLGALVAVHYLLRAGEGAACAGAVLVSPAVRLRFEPGRSRLVAARLLTKVAPALPVPSGVRPRDLTRDEDAAREAARDPLTHRRTSARAFLETLDAMAEARRRAAEVRLPLLVLGGLGDTLVSPEAMREFVDAASSPDKRLRIDPQRRHDLFHDADAARVIGEVARWLAAHTPS